MRKLEDLIERVEKLEHAIWRLAAHGSPPEGLMSVLWEMHAIQLAMLRALSEHKDVGSGE